MTDEESISILKLLDGHVARLREQGFDSVLILCTKSDDKNGTRYWEQGGGNYLARYGHASLWVEKEKLLNGRVANDRESGD